MWRHPNLGRSSLLALLALGIAGLVAAEVEEISKARPRGPSDTAEGNSSTLFEAGGSMISADGRYLVFLSEARELVSGQVDSKGTSDVFLYDRTTCTTVLVSLADGSPRT